MLVQSYVAVLLLQLLSAWLFFSGFVLPRTVRDDVATAALEDLDAGRSRYGRRKVLMVVIDALRYDNVVGDRARFHSLRQQARLLMSEAPTTTAQRLKAVTSGGIPAFIELGSAFDSDAMTQDNLIQQLATHGRTAGIFGDDTWVALFPRGLWDTVHVFPSFNVWDLDSVDHGIMARMEDVYAEGGARLKHDFTVLHFLGVDHAGHRYGPRHAAMQKKVEEVDAFVAELIGNLTRLNAEEHVCLMVLGDHGMTEDGQHGGGTDLEVRTALHVRAFPDTGRRDTALWTSGGPMDQIDLAPTLSVLLGVPFPFGNLGVVDRGVLAFLHAGVLDSDSKKVIELEGYLALLLRNVEQVLSGVRADISVAALDDELERLRDRHARLLSTRPTQTGGPSSSLTAQVFLEEGEKIAQRLRRVATAAAAAARAEWASMKPPLLYVAVALSLIPLIILHDADSALLPTWGHTLEWFEALFPSVVQAVALTSNSYVVTEDRLTPFLLASMLLAASVRHRSQSMCAAAAVVRVMPEVLSRSLRRFGTHHLHEANTPVHDILSWTEFGIRVALPAACMVVLLLRRRGCWLERPLLGTGWRAGLSLLPGGALLAHAPASVRSAPSAAAHPSPRGPHRLLRAAAGGRSVAVACVAIPYLILCAHCACKLLPDARRAENTLALLCIGACCACRNVWCAAALITGPQGVAVWLAVLYVVQCIEAAPDTLCERQRGVMYALVGWVAFFSSGHQTVLSAVDFGSAFVGFDELHHTVHGAVMVGFNTFCCFLLPHRRGTGFLAACSCTFTGALLAVTMHRRHLMVWEVFAPRLLFAVAIAPVCTLAALASPPADPDRTA
eukprot:TRINITY_DN4738_c0_g1_i1.p1 TRINITY_DN4738_c0_g1~~TRINITY_DN4738_c0_g1_i1.p1  ORF type:complete len:840 (+),score=79.90 TRINITY_DN4738_c0_g1_i1:87-2606(+)